MTIYLLMETAGHEIPPSQYQLSEFTEIFRYIYYSSFQLNRQARVTYIVIQQKYCILMFEEYHMM